MVDEGYKKEQVNTTTALDSQVWNLEFTNYSLPGAFGTRKRVKEAMKKNARGMHQLFFFPNGPSVLRTMHSDT